MNWPNGLTIARMIMGPIVQKFAFGAYWTGFPFGMDLTDNKTLIVLIFWIIAFVMLRKRPTARVWTILASLMTLIIFMIPHSMHGSELDYTKVDSHIESVE